MTTTHVSRSRGYLITLEGIDGTGKTLQSALLCKALEQAGYNPLSTKEPSQEVLKSIILDNNRLNPAAVFYLFMSDRIQHVHETIIPALTQGKIVVSARYLDSTIAYQLFGHGEKLKQYGLTKKYLRETNLLAAGGVLPDLTILLDAPAEIGIKRSRLRKKNAPLDRFERLSLGFFRKAREGFLSIADSEPRVAVVDATLSIPEVHREILVCVAERLKLRLLCAASSPSSACPEISD